MGKRGPKPKGRVNTTWRPELAYAIGLIAADGSLSKNGRHIDFTSKDKELVETYLECLDISDIKIGTKKSGGDNKRVYCRAQFGDVNFYKWLEGIGLSPNKSLTLNNITIPDKYFFDFVRGEWDGDGTIYCSQDKRWKNSFIVSVGFTSGSKDFLLWLREEINKRLDTSGFLSAINRGYQLRYARKDSRRIFDAMFYKNNLPHLARKFAKAQKIFTMTGL